MELFSVILRDSYGREIRRLLDENRDLSSALSIVTTERNVLNAANVERESKLNEAERQLRNVTSRCSQMEASVADSTEKLRTAKKIEEELKDNLERSEAKAQSLNSKLAESLVANKETDELKILVSKQAEELRILRQSAEVEQREQKVKKNKKQCVVS
jgi:chromosome segregation ATPase